MNTCIGVTNKTAKCFKMSYFSTSDLDFNFLNIKHIDVISADTETKLYYNGMQLTDTAAYDLYKENGQKWIKENIEVKAYAFTIAHYESFALFQCIEDFLTAVAILNVKLVLWYNARFDFCLFDYYFLKNNWVDATERIKQNDKYMHLQDCTFTSLNGDFGQRYQMQVWKRYINQNSKKVVHKFKMIDVCNIANGGLAKNLEDWNITDINGKKIRKLSMNYVESDIVNDMSYMIADTKGLFYLAITIDKTLFNLTGFSLLNGDFLTAGGLAIKTLLKEMYGKENFKTNKKLFKHDFKMSIELDKEYRKRALYRGGICQVNPKYKGHAVKNVYKYDVNSMYPSVMYEMLYPFGGGYYTKTYTKKSGFVYILFISCLCGTLKNKKIPILQNFKTKKFEKIIDIEEPFYIWSEELDELEEWYDLSYTINFAIAYKANKCKGAQNFVKKFYDIKSQNKGAVRNCAKLELNSCYGKLAQRCERTKGHYELSENGYTHFIRTETEIDNKSMLSVVVGSRITALSRVKLLKFIREICNEDVEKNFLYCDTDSVHALTKYNNCDESALGKMKCEGIYKNALYLAPKSYLLQSINDVYEVHCKGVNTNEVAKELNGKDFGTAKEIFKPNRNFKTLCGLNCKGGKALIYIDKMILNDKNYMCDKIPIKHDGIFFEE